MVSIDPAAEVAARHHRLLLLHAHHQPHQQLPLPDENDHDHVIDSGSSSSHNPLSHAVSAPALKSSTAPSKPSMSATATATRTTGRSSPEPLSQQQQQQQHYLAKRFSADLPRLGVSAAPAAPTATSARHNSPRSFSADVAPQRTGMGANAAAAAELEFLDRMVRELGLGATSAGRPVGGGAVAASPVEDASAVAAGIGSTRGARYEWEGGLPGLSFASEDSRKPNAVSQQPRSSGLASAFDTVSQQTPHHHRIQTSTATISTSSSRSTPPAPLSAPLTAASLSSLSPSPPPSSASSASLSSPRHSASSSPAPEAVPAMTTTSKTSSGRDATTPTASASAMANAGALAAALAAWERAPAPPASDFAHPTTASSGGLFGYPGMGGMGSRRGSFAFSTSSTASSATAIADASAASTPSEGAAKQARLGGAPPSSAFDWSSGFGAYAMKAAVEAKGIVQPPPPATPTSNTGSNGPLPPGYVCKLCNVEGHWMKNCALFKNRRQTVGAFPTNAPLGYAFMQQQGQPISPSTASTSSASIGGLAGAVGPASTLLSSPTTVPTASSTTLPSGLNHRVPAGWPSSATVLAPGTKGGMVGSPGTAPSAASSAAAAAAAAAMSASLGAGGLFGNGPAPGAVGFGQFGTGMPGMAAGNATSVPPDGYICHKCNTPGHWIQQCPLHRAGLPPDTYVCRICSIPGHWIWACPQRSHNNVNPAAAAAAAAANAQLLKHCQQLVHQQVARELQVAVQLQQVLQQQQQAAGVVGYGGARGAHPQGQRGAAPQQPQAFGQAMGGANGWTGVLAPAPPASVMQQKQQQQQQQQMLNQLQFQQQLMQLQL
ncbi:hypothetical protein HDU96_002516 [Phlyctochytrium bullatum]|nr:hypothetical protein HDU96_002516 [Phlyctochytrium bullatum]